MKHYFLALSLLVSSICLSQGNILLEDHVFQYTHSYDKEINSLLLSDTTFTKLPYSEKMFFYWVNLFRKDPESFSTKFLRPFLVQFPSANTGSASNLLKELVGIKKLNFLFPDSLLIDLSKIHASDLATVQKQLSHVSSAGKTFGTRMHDAGILKCAGENLIMGRKEPLEHLILFLIDHNVPGYGHRRALLNPLYNIMGCSYSQMVNSPQFVLVQLFSCY